jgi:hypothetical protein
VKSVELQNTIKIINIYNYIQFKSFNFVMKGTLHLARNLVFSDTLFFGVGAR